MICALLVLATAQADEHRRFRRAQEAYVKLLEARAAESAAYLHRVSEYLNKPAEERATMPMPPPHFPEKTPPGPRADRYMLVARIRQSASIAAFAVAAALPIAWAMSTRDFARRHRRLMAETMLALALFATIGMMLGAGHLANWKSFRIGTNAAGYGLVLVPLGVVAVVLASRADASAAGPDAAGGADEEGGGSKM